MKRFFITTLALAMSVIAFAQNTDTPLKVYLAEDSNMPVEAQKYLTARLEAAVGAENVGVAEYGATQFMLAAKVLTNSKDVLGSAPATYSLNLDVILYIADWVNGKQYSRLAINVKGVGKSEEKAYVSAFKTIKYDNPKISKLVADGRQSIIKYYEAEGDVIIKQALTLSAQRQYDRALFLLAAIPSACPDVYAKAQDATMEVYQGYIDYEGKKLFTEAKGVWAAGQSRESAQKAAALLSEIDPEASCYAAAGELLDEIEAKVGEISEMKVYTDNLDLKKKALEAARQIGVAYGQNQQPNTTNLLN